MLETMIVLIIKAIFAGGGGYAIGRSLSDESIFEGLREKYSAWAYHPITTSEDSREPGTYHMRDVNNHLTAVVVQRFEDHSEAIVSEDGYRRDGKFPLLLSLFFGKLADLWQCKTCTSVHASVWLAVLGVWFSVIPVGVLAGLFAMSVAYLMVDRY